MSKSRKKILILMSGSIAAYKACSLISLLVKNQIHVKVAASASALKFVGEATLEGLTGEKVHSDLWEKGHAMDHIQLERWADLILAAPASAHFLNRCASGIGDDLLTTLFLAHEFKKPFLVAPAMNTAMYLNPVTQASLQKLKALGLQVLETASGVLACGEKGYGRLLEPDQLWSEIEPRLHALSESQSVPERPSAGPSMSPPLRIPKILITAGGTREPLDDVRYLGNASTGRTGVELATHFSELGFDVTLDLAVSSSVRADHLSRVHRFDTTKSLEKLLQDQLQKESFDWIFHAAAVSDFSVDAKPGKISSDEDLTLRLKRNPKILNQLKAWSQNRHVKLVGFKLTSGLEESAVLSKVQTLQKASQTDFVVQNDVSSLKSRESHRFEVFQSDSRSVATGVPELAQYFSSQIGAHYDSRS
ncbi:MAG: bifunctional phosphopantothenoylcysteine decarboxylase/phosphopantothenate--cysteine ligase CoaBC [Bdellovibrionales bacterium]